MGAFSLLLDFHAEKAEVLVDYNNHKYPIFSLSVRVLLFTIAAICNDCFMHPMHGVKLKTVARDGLQNKK
jgi:hypothetical protein